MSLTVRKAATASAIALAAMAAGAASAQADIEKNLEYGCKYPLVDKKPLSINVKSNIPLFAKINEQQPAFVVNAIATAKDGTSEAIDTLDAYKLSGVSEARASLVFPSGFVQGNLKVPLTVDPYIRAPNAPIPDPLVLTANGKTPSVNLDELGKTDIRLDKISLNLSAFYQDGTPINVKKLLTDFDGNPVSDSDGNVNTFDVYCKLNADQSPVIATICVNATGLPDNSCDTGNKPPTQVSGLKLDSKTATSANLSWTAATDPDAGDSVKGYNVYKDGVKVTATPVAGLTYAAAGLTASTAYKFTVEAVDTKDLAGPKSTELSVTTDGAPNTKPSKVVGLKGDTITGTSANLSWTAATDPDAGDSVKGYNVYKDGVKVTPTPVTGLTYAAAGLVPSTTYKFTVEAVDSKDLAGDKSDELSIKTLSPPNTKPSKVAGVKVDSKTDKTANISWTAATDPDAGDSVKGYNVYKDGVKVTATPIAGLTYAAAGLTASTTYKFTVEAVDSKDLAGDKSDELSVTTDGPPNTAPNKVVGLKTDSKTDKTANISWTAATDPDAGDSVKGYNVYKDGVKVTATPITGLTYAAAGLTASTTYKFTVEAIDSKGLNGAKSDELSVTTDGPPNSAPAKVTGLKVDDTTETTVDLSWAASADPDAGDTVSYNVYKDGVKVTATPITATSYKATGLTKKTKYTFDVEATDGKSPAAKTSIDATTDDTFVIPDTTAPTDPTPSISSTVCPLVVKISWTASTDEAGGSGLKEYVVSYKGKSVKVAAGTTTYTLPDPTTGALEVKVQAVDNAGNISVGKTATANIPIADCIPGKPVVTPGSVTYNSVALSWTQPVGGAPAEGFNVYRDGVKINAATIPASTKSYTDSTVAAEKTYKYVVEAIGGFLPTKSDEVTVTTPKKPDTGTCPQGFACYDYGLKGSTSLKTLTTGTLPLTGGIKAQLSVADGKFTADLTLNNTSGRLTAAGFLPLTAKVGFVPVGKTTGQLDDATATKPQSITTNSKVRIKVLEVKLFGAIPLAGGNSCQTKELSDINLKSTNAFDPLKGGTIGGTYAISNLNGCGPLNGLVSPLTAGKGNSITLNLVKQP